MRNRSLLIAAAAALVLGFSADARSRPQSKTKMTRSTSGETAVSTGPVPGLAAGRSEGGGGISFGVVNLGRKPAGSGAKGSAGGTRGGGAGVSGGTGTGGGGGAGGGGGGGAAPSVPIPIPRSCFGRNVVSGDWDSPYASSDKQEGFGVDYRTRRDLMHVVRFKTGPPGYTAQFWVIYDESFFISSFISPKPCDYEEAYKLGLSRRAGGGWFVPVVTDSQAVEMYKPKGPNDIYDQWRMNPKDTHLLPNTYYYMHVINVDMPMTDTRLRPLITTGAQLAAAPETCDGNRGDGWCYYLRFTFQTK